MLLMKAIYLLRQSPIEYLSIVIFSVGITLLSFLQIYFHEVYKFSVVQASIILSVATIGQFIGSLFSTRLFIEVALYL